MLYVSAVNDVRARKNELAQVTTNVTRWQATANSYAALVASSQERIQQQGAVRQLALARFPWSKLLSQISGLLPAHAALTTLQATTPTQSAPAPASAAATAPTPPTAQLTGCAQTQSTVAQTMTQLRRITGVTSVSLASSTDSDSSTSNAGASGGQGSCSFPIQFAMSLTFAVQDSGSSSPSSGPTTLASPSATPTASSATKTTGASQ